MDIFVFIRGGHINLSSVALNLQFQWGPANGRHMDTWEDGTELGLCSTYSQLFLYN